MYCIDASVLIAVFDETDVFHETSLRLFELIIQKNIDVIMPAFALVEIAGSLARKGYKHNDIMDYIDYLKSCEKIEFVFLDNRLYELAINVALRLKRVCQVFCVNFLYPDIHKYFSSLSSK